MEGEQGREREKKRERERERVAESQYRTKSTQTAIVCRARTGFSLGNVCAIYTSPVVMKPHICIVTMATKT